MKLRSAYQELTAGLRSLPTTLIIGAQRSGTTSLFNYLVQHPDVRRPWGKEIHFFDLHYHRGVRWYRSRFPFAARLRDGAMTLDASPYYLLHPTAPQRAAQLLPDARLIAVLRNPVERAYSHYQHELRHGWETLSFAEAIECEAERLAGEEERLRREPDYYSFHHHHHSYTRRGLYLQQLRRWMEHFPRSSLLVLQSEWLFRETAEAMAVVHDFLGLRPHRLDRYAAFYKGDHEQRMPPELRQRLCEYFEPHNRELYAWLGRDYDWS